MPSNRLQEKINDLQQSHKNSFDGFLRSEQAERSINKTVKALMLSPDGENFMAYLRSITINTALPATATDAELRYLEGQRRLYGIIEKRLNFKETE